MEHIIIGTAGHIDHGKTALVQALTGRDTDQTKEEKDRGISINLGFTYFDLPNNKRAGIIDVPGHEKFLPNMLAGVCGMDMVLLVIALDEGIMPQTREHMDIIEQMNIKNGIIVLTKRDKVEDEWKDLMCEEIRGQLKNSIFFSWPELCVSSKTGQGIDTLKQQIVELSDHIQRSRSVSGPFRMPIDRIISLKGLGTLVCGTVMEGSITVGKELEIYPSGQRVKVRNIQTHGIDTSETEAGQRTSLLLSNIKKEDLKRGMTIAEPESLSCADRIDVKIRMTRFTERILKNQSRMHLHIGTDEVLCRVVIFQKDALLAEEDGYAQLVTEEPLSVRRGDRFILRFYSPLETIAGGVVIDADARKKKRNDPLVIEQLKIREENKKEAIIMNLLEEYNYYPNSLEEIVMKTKEEKEIVERILDNLAEEKQCVKWHGKQRNFYWDYSKARRVEENLERFLKNYHVQYPYRVGCDKKRIKAELFPEWKLDRFELMLHQLERDERIRIVNQVVANADFEICMDEQLDCLAKQLCPQLEAIGFQFTEYKKLRSPNHSEMQYNDMIECLIQLGILVRISDEFVTTKAVACEVERRVRVFFQENEILSYSQLRDLLGSTRKSVRPLMTYLDQQKITVWFGHETERKEYREEGVC